MVVFTGKKMPNQNGDKCFAGIDVGSQTAKAVIVDTDGIKAKEIIRTGANPAGAGEAVFKKALSRANKTKEDVARIVATGYGRVSLSFADKKVTEITCHAKGVRYLNKDVEALIDIGGQDSKAVKLNPDGSVNDFVMNDRCAAGTGRFLEIMARALEVDIDTFSSISKDSAAPSKINSTCIVFAESEVISLLASGKSKKDIAAGLHLSIARRVGSMARRIRISQRCAFVGGVAKNIGMRDALEIFLGHSFLAIEEDSQITGALGASIIAMESFTKQ